MTRRADAFQTIHSEGGSVAARFAAPAVGTEGEIAGDCSRRITG